LPTASKSSTLPSIYGLSLRIVAIDTQTPANWEHYYDPAGTLRKTGAASTTTYTSSSAVITQTGGSTGTLSITADTTNACLNVSWTAPNSDTWHLTVVIGPDAEAY
jgi:hypothetical protein